MRAWLVILLMVPVAAGQGHTHAMGSGFAVVSDVGHDGLAFVGSPTHFELIAFGDDLVPDFHQDLPVRVSLDNRTLYETTTVTGHDYDGVHGFDIVFPRPGHWKVEALAEGTPVAWLEGEAVWQEPSPVQVDVSWALVAPPYLAIDVVTERTVPATGETVQERADHTDVLVEYLDDQDRVVLRTKLHIHDAPVELQEGTVESAEQVRITAFRAAPDQGAAIVPTTVTYDLLTPAPSLQATPPAPSPNAARNDAIVAAGDWSLIGTYDPFTSVGPDTLQHLTALVVDQDGMVVPHMSYNVHFRGPHGLIFRTDSVPDAYDTIHEHDGIYEVAARMATPGPYELQVTATKGQWSQTITMPYTVLPPVMATVAGPQLFRMTAPSFDAGAAAPLVFEGANPAGRPFAHGELDLRIIDEEGLVILRDKLHTHGDGTFPVTLALPRAGSYNVDILPFPLDPQPAGPYYKQDIGTPLQFTLQAAGTEPAWPAVDGEEAPHDAPTETVPTPLALLFLALAAALLARKR